MGINMHRFKGDFEAIARFGALDGGGVTRLAFSEEDMAARAYLVDAMADAGLKVTVDAFGNIRGRREGDCDLPPVMIGSHLDTVPAGGNYDGIVGVIAGLEVVRTLNDLGQTTRRPVEVINFSAEESSRFGVATLGSKSLVGKLGEEDLERLADGDGLKLGEALRLAGCPGGDPASARLFPGEVHAFLELHIEQGSVLEERRCPIGIVTAIAAPTRFHVIMEGRADHSGNTPMAMRKDALAAAAEIVLGVERIAGEGAGEHTVGTVGYLRATPGAMNVIPARVELGIDIRDIDAADKKKAVEAVDELMDGIAERRGISIERELLCDEDPVSLSSNVADCIEKEAIEAGLSFIRMPSGAGHDAMNMAGVTEAGMIFIPSIDGISHNVAEESRFEDIEDGTALLLRATMALAGS